MTVEAKLAGKVVVVTGASRGIGYAAAIEVAKRGAHVVAVARTVGGLEELDDEIGALGGNATLVPFDLVDGDAIDRLGKSIFDRWGHLDGLIVNAATLGPISPLPHISAKDFSAVMEMNVTSPFRILRSFDLLLRQAEAARVVFVSSNAADTAKAYWGLYAASKSALNAMAKAYSNETKQTKMGVNVFYPGTVRTAMRAMAVPGEDPETLPPPEEIAPSLVDLMMPECSERGQIFDVRTGKFREI